ncbi:MAG: tetratricopeptide repeat protein, partial [Candidatus Wallbacteria bacterium]|nr:tetratricopeptide repeat protein [Candidatus Wallbacteria bacterium]
MRTARQLTVAACAILALAAGPLPADNLQVGKDYYELRRFTDALASLKLAIQENPQAWEAYYYSGLIFQESGKPDLALKYFASAWRVQPGNEKLGKQLTETYIQNAAKARASGGADAAIAELEVAIKGGFFSVELVNQLLVHYGEQNKWESTISLGNEVFRRLENFTLFPKDGAGTKRTHFLVGRA